MISQLVWTTFFEQKVLTPLHVSSPTLLVYAIRSTIGRAGQAYTELEWSIYPGATKGTGDVYEDDGETYDYILKGKSATTTLSYEYDADGTLSVQIVPTVSGGYELLSSRAHTLRIPNKQPPSSVTFNGSTTLAWSRYGGSAAGVWWYDGAELAVVINLPIVDASATIFVAAHFPKTSSGTAVSFDGLKGKLNAARRAKAALNLRRMAPGEHSGSPVRATPKPVFTH